MYIHTSIMPSQGGSLFLSPSVSSFLRVCSCLFLCNTLIEVCWFGYKCLYMYMYIYVRVSLRLWECVRVRRYAYLNQHTSIRVLQRERDEEERFTWEDNYKLCVSTESSWECVCICRVYIYAHTLTDFLHVHTLSHGLSVRESVCVFVPSCECVRRLFRYNTLIELCWLGYVCVHVWVYVCGYTYMYMGISTWIHIHVCVCMYVGICLCTPYADSGLCVCIYMWVCTDKGSELEAGTTSYWPVNMNSIYIYMYGVYMLICVCVCTYSYIQIDRYESRDYLQLAGAHM